MNDLPLIGNDWWEPICDPLTGKLRGQVQILIALGSEEQIRKLAGQRGFNLNLVKFKPAIQTPKLPSVTKEPIPSTQYSISVKHKNLSNFNLTRSRNLNLGPAHKNVKVTYKPLELTARNKKEREEVYEKIDKCVQTIQMDNIKEIKQKEENENSNVQKNSNFLDLNPNPNTSQNPSTSQNPNSSLNTNVLEVTNPNFIGNQNLVENSNFPQNPSLQHKNVLEALLEKLMQQSNTNLISTTLNNETLKLNSPSSNMNDLLNVNKIVGDLNVSNNTNVKKTSDLLDTLEQALNTSPNLSPKIHEMDKKCFKAHVVVEGALHLPTRKKCKSKRPKASAISKPEEVMPSTYVTFETMPGANLQITPVVQKNASPTWDYRCDVTLPLDLLTNVRFIL